MELLLYYEKQQHGVRQANRKSSTFAMVKIMVFSSRSCYCFFRLRTVILQKFQPMRRKLKKVRLQFQKLDVLCGLDFFMQVISTISALVLLSLERRRMEHRSLPSPNPFILRNQYSTMIHSQIVQSAMVTVGEPTPLLWKARLIAQKRIRAMTNGKSFKNKILCSRLLKPGFQINSIRRFSYAMFFSSSLVAVYSL